MNHSIRFRLLAALAVIFMVQLAAGNPEKSFQDLRLRLNQGDRDQASGPRATASASVGPGGPTSQAAANAHYQQTAPVRPLLRQRPRPPVHPRSLPVYDQSSYESQSQYKYDAPRVEQFYRRPPFILAHARHPPSPPSYGPPVPTRRVQSPRRFSSYPQYDAAASAYAQVAVERPNHWPKPSYTIPAQYHEAQEEYHDETEPDTQYKYRQQSAYPYEFDQGLERELEKEYQQRPPMGRNNVRSNRNPSVGNHRAQAAASASTAVNGRNRRSSSSAAAMAAVEAANVRSPQTAAAYARSSSPENYANYDSTREDQSEDEEFEDIDHYNEKDGLYGDNPNGYETSSYTRKTDSEDIDEEQSEDGMSFHRGQRFDKTKDLNEYTKIHDGSEDITHTDNEFKKSSRTFNVERKLDKKSRTTGSHRTSLDQFDAKTKKNTRKVNEQVDERSLKNFGGVVDTTNAQTERHLDEEDVDKHDTRGLGNFRGLNGEVHGRRLDKTPASVAAAVASASFKN